MFTVLNRKHINITNQKKDESWWINSSSCRNHCVSNITVTVSSGYHQHFSSSSFSAVLLLSAGHSQVLRTASTKPQDSICGDHREVLRLHDLRFVEMGEPICHLSESPWTKHENATKCIKMPQLSGFPLLKGVEPNCTWLDIRNCETIANCKSSVRP